MSHYGALIKAIDLVVVLNIGFLLWRYVPALWAGVQDNPGRFANKLILGIVVGWSGTWVLYANLTYAFWHHDFDPTYSVAGPVIRLTYLTLTLLGTSIHVCASIRPGDGFWKLLAAWFSGVVALVLAFYLVEVGRPWG